jgi:hypothetical protein
MPCANSARVQFDNRSETTLTIEQSVTETAITVRAPRHYWIGLFLAAGLSLVPAALFAIAGMTWPAVGWLVACCLSVAGALLIRTITVELTPESAKLHSFRHRSVPWQDVQSVVRYHRFGPWVVRLIPDEGKPVTLRAPTSTLGYGRPQYELDFYRIEQWWLAHRDQPGPGGLA